MASLAKDMFSNGCYGFVALQGLILREVMP